MLLHRLKVQDHKYVSSLGTPVAIVLLLMSFLQLYECALAVHACIAGTF